MPTNFVNSDLKQKVDQLMDELWAGGVNNPMTAIEQISYLMFLKSLSEAFEKFHELPNLSPIGKVLFRQAHLKIFNRPTLRSVVSIIDGMDYNNPQKYDTDVKGDLYEYLLSKIAISGTNGQFRTPRPIIKMMVNLIKPKAGQYILDPTCGTEGFLIQVYLYIMEQNTSEEMKKEGHITGDRLRPDQHEFLKTHALTGYDNDIDMV